MSDNPIRFDQGCFPTGFEYQYAPGVKAYTRREAIPEAERCTHCDGLGSVRIRFSGCFGNVDSRGSRDWQRCHDCQGTGRKPDNAQPR